MKRSGPIKRTPMRRSEGPSLARSERPKACEVRERACKHCGRPFPVNPHHPLIGHCSPRCGMALHRARENAERESVKVRKDALKTVSQWEEECRKIVQKIARIRDRHDGCISCHMGPDYAGAWHGSHFRPAGNHSAVELHLWNIHKSCAQCNLHKGGNIAAYRPRLIEKIGLERVEWLEAQNQVTKRSVDYLKRFKTVMGKRMRRMEKAAK